jgi:hypothetical protein
VKIGQEGEVIKDKEITNMLNQLAGNYLDPLIVKKSTKGAERAKSLVLGLRGGPKMVKHIQPTVKQKPIGAAQLWDMARKMTNKVNKMTDRRKRAHAQRQVNAIRQELMDAGAKGAMKLSKDLESLGIIAEALGGKVAQSATAGERIVGTPAARMRLDFYETIADAGRRAVGKYGTKAKKLVESKPPKPSAFSKSAAGTTMFQRLSESE